MTGGVRLVVKHDRDGVRYVQPYLGTNKVTGRPMRPYRRFPDAGTDEEALAMAEEWVATVRGAVALGTSPRLSDVLEAYVRYLESNGASPNTARTYRTYAAHVSAVVGSQRADSLGPMDFSALQERLLESGGADGAPLSGQTVCGIHWFLSGAYRHLGSMGLVGSNPLDAVGHPSPGQGCATAYDEEDFARLEAALGAELASDGADAASRRRRTVAFAAWLALHTGLRVGEVCALRRRDAQAARGVVCVGATVVEVRGRGAVRRGRPKTSSSRRNVAITRGDADVIAAHEAWQDGWLGHTGRDVPLCTTDGGWMRPTSVSRDFSAMRDSLGLTAGTSFHTLRHTHATWLLVSGVDPKTVSERLGHGSVATTLRLYAHVLPGRDAQAAEGFAAVARGMAGAGDGG